MKKLCNKGFTLVELIIVIAILAIIMMIVVPNVPTIIQRQRVRADRASAQKIAEYVRAWYSDYSTDDRSKVTKFEAATITASGSTATPAKNNETPAKEIAPIIYTELDDTIDTYIEETFTPSSLLDAAEIQEPNQVFAVFLTGGKIGVAVVPAADATKKEITSEANVVTYSATDGKLDVNYDGYRRDSKHTTSNNIIYIEGEE